MPNLLSFLFSFLALILSFGFAPAGFAADIAPFEIRVIDSATGRGVPLVELRTTTGKSFFTDNAGRVAFREPGLMSQSVFFHISSHGYQYPADGFGYRGQNIEITPGERIDIEINRLNLAERLYRSTGYGLFRDSVILGHETPLNHPLLNGGVIGQDSVQATVYGGKIYWFWGDTDRPSYPLGKFRTTGATSPLPEEATVHPRSGIDLTYFVDDEFVRPMTPLPSDEGQLMWISGLVTVTDTGDSTKLIAHYDHRAGLGDAVGQGLLVWNDEREQFDILQEIPLKEKWRRPIGQATRWTENGSTHLLFVRPWPTVRVPDDFRAVQNREAYEAFTCLLPETEFAGAQSQVERDTDGQLVWDWKKNTGPINQMNERLLIEAGLIDPTEARFQLRDSETGSPIQVHRATVNWNEYLNQWVMIATEINGRSHLGEVWFARAESPTGPWPQARRIVTHDNYTFYNPAHHTFLDEDGGRLIYFEATYTHQFTDNPSPTPHYDYNQIMYRLDLEPLR